MRQFIVVDFEATCWKNRKRKGKGTDDVSRSEIIQVGAIKLDEQFEMIDLFESFVRPVLEVTLSDYCQELTGINQRDVDHADDWEIIGKQFYDWSTESKSAIPYFFAWGNMDEKFLNNEKNNKDILIDEMNFLRSRWFNLQKIFNRFHLKGSKIQHSVISACELLRVSPKGFSHDALGDAENAMLILKAIEHKVDWDFVLNNRKSFR